MIGADSESSPVIQSAEVVLPCAELAPNLEFFTRKLAFDLELIFPADQPRVAVISGHGVRLRLEQGLDAPPSILRLHCRNPLELGAGNSFLLAPNGTRIELVAADPAVELPAERQSFVVATMGAEDAWVVGRAGMHYRDLIPGRQGGRFIASHIRILEGGPVPDYAHFHRIRFQLIYCYKGWVRVVYEDQGEPFVLQAGDCVLQPPLIRHRVLESSPGLEVIEIGCPAEHETWADHKISLPTGKLQPEREFAGQRFVRHIALDARWVDWRLPGFEARNTGIDQSTRGLASVNIVRPGDNPQTGQVIHEQEFLFLFVLSGSLNLDCEGPGARTMTAGDSCVIPKGMGHSLGCGSSDLKFLEVTLPAEFKSP